MKDKMKKQKGITLIALVITIIVLIILAAVGISMIMGDNGLIENARWSKEAEKFGAVEEAAINYINEYELNKYGNKQERVIAKIAQTTDTPVGKNKESSVPEEKKYPVTKEQLIVKDMEDTLKTTICYLENLEENELEDETKVKLMYIDREKLQSYLGKKADEIEEHEFVFNVISKKLYWREGHKHSGKIYHTLRYGVVPSSSPKEEEENPDETKVTIHYLPEEGAIGSEYTQEILDNSKTIKLKSIEELKFKQEGKLFVHWKEVPDPEEEENAGNSTGKTYNDGDEIDLSDRRIPRYLLRSCMARWSHIDIGCQWRNNRRRTKYNNRSNRRRRSIKNTNTNRI